MNQLLFVLYSLINAINAHPVIAYVIFSSAVGSLPPPTEQSKNGYKWLYAFLNALAANLPALSRRVGTYASGKRETTEVDGHSGAPSVDSVQEEPRGAKNVQGPIARFR